MKNILVTGGAGFIGRNLIEQLVEMPGVKQVHSIDNYSTGTTDNQIDGARYNRMDINSRHWVIDRGQFFFKGVDTIFHLAAQARIQVSIYYPYNTLKTNILGTSNVLELARILNARVIFAGSSSVTAGIHRSPYALSKYAAENLCKVYRKNYGLQTFTACFFNVYGPYQLREGPSATVIGIFEKARLNGVPIPIVLPGQQTRDFTHIEDVVNGLIKIGYYKGTMDKFELGYGQEWTIEEVAGVFGGPTKYLPERKGEYDQSFSNSKLTKKVLEWTPKRDLRHYIRDWVAKNQHTFLHKTV